MNFNKTKLFYLFTLITGVLISCRSTRSLVIQNNTYKSYKIDSSITEDSIILARIKPYKMKLDSIMNIVIGDCENELMKGQPESTMGNLLADITFIKGKEKSGKPVDFALMNNGGIRNTFSKGPITIGSVYEVMPFENELVILTVDSTIIDSIFYYVANKKGIPLSNASCEIKNGKAENIKIGGNPYNRLNKYNLSVSDYLASGGDEMSFLTLSKEKVILDYKIRDAIIDYIKEQSQKGKKIQSNIEGRVVNK